MSVRKLFNMCLGIFSFLADVITIESFFSKILEKNMSNLWVFSSIVALFLIITLTFVSLYFFENVSDYLGNLIGYISGGAYIIASYLIYVFWMWKFMFSNSLHLLDFFAFFVIFASFALTGIWIIHSINSSLLEYFSYGYAFTTLMTVLGFVYKYIHISSPFSLKFIGEIFIFFVGSSLFWKLQKNRISE